MQSNRGADRFWEHTVAAFTGEMVQASRIESGGEDWRVFEFESKTEANGALVGTS
jgi:hypothetical protein